MVSKLEPAENPYAAPRQDTDRNAEFRPTLLQLALAILMCVLSATAAFLIACIGVTAASVHFLPVDPGGIWGHVTLGIASGGIVAVRIFLKGFRQSIQEARAAADRKRHRALIDAN